MRMPRAQAIALAVLALVACEGRRTEGAAPAAAPRPGERILLGHVASLTGAEASFGDSTDKGIRLAIEEVNARGGVKGRLLALETRDDQGSPEQAAAAAARLVTVDRVAVLIGEVASSRSLAMAPVADAHRVPMISPSSTHPRVTRDGRRVRPYVFRVCFTDAFQGAAMARFARERLGLSRVAVLHEAGDYSAGLADHFRSRFRKLGGTVVEDQRYQSGARHFEAQLLAIRARRPEALYVPGYYADVAAIALQARELGIGVPLLGGDGWDSASLQELAGEALEGSYFSNHYSPDEPGQRIQDFVRRYRKRFGAAPDGFAAQGYDAARVAADALGRATDLSGAAVRDAIAATRDYPGVTGVISIDADHDAVKPAAVLEIRGGAARFVATVEPE